ncbi:hypothetical protein ACH4U7_52885 [Streptomyces sp. NPDC020845]|uniref:hypothetical protein n=1 Tax=Streptomyces sp. NPDC020845 TaxID=3365096 RepID=UPI0037B374C3
MYEAATAESDSGRPLWRVQGTSEAHRDLDDAIRSLRRPSSWTREREQVAAWARRLLADETLLAIDVETTGLENAYATGPPRPAPRDSRRKEPVRVPPLESPPLTAPPNCAASG